MKAALSLDLDNKWSYLKTHGDSTWQSFPSYLNALVPRVLDILDGFGIRITFFIVGQDAALPEHDDVLAEIARRGHEIGSHSYFHEPWMHRHSDRAIADELARAEECIERVTGQRPRGFRGPGFTHSASILDALVRRGYLYDASSLPTFIGPLARAYYFRSMKLDAKQASERGDLFGHFADGFQPNRPHQIETAAGPIVEMPVTTFPFLRFPIHVSYVLYIAAISPRMAMAYFNTALQLCKLTRTTPSILLHPLDFLSGDECPELAFFPAMGLPGEVKRGVLLETLRSLTRNFEVLPLRATLDRDVGAVRNDYADNIALR
jgi:hypothetical protein